MVPPAVQGLKTDTPAALGDVLPCLGDDLRVHPADHHVYVWVGHALGFDYHHGLVLDPALSAGFPKVGQESGLMGQDFLQKVVSLS